MVKNLLVGVIYLSAIFTALTGCTSSKMSTNPGDPSFIKVSFQERKDYFNSDQSVKISNRFDGARIDDLKVVNDSTFTIVIRAENTPINPSPWYAFRIISKKERNLYFQLEYENVKHRYLPKYSRDLKTWLSVDTVYTNEQKSVANFSIKAEKGTTTVSAQELMTSKDNQKWIKDMAKLPDVEQFVIGYSLLGKPLYALKNTNSQSKKIIFVISRQHPPEVTGYLAMKAFVERVLGASAEAKNFRQNFELIVVPMMNPDGVDNGHWRHNAGGVDLNRDWKGFVQPETKAIRDYVATRTQEGNKVLFFLDFHSTWYDVFYVNKENPGSLIPGFVTEWLKGMEKVREGYKARIEPSGNEGVVSKAWFSREHQAESVTYEVGDLTPRNYISTIGILAADQMMKLLSEK